MSEPTVTEEDRATAAEDWRVAVQVRPHYPPCDFPDHACGCGATEDRYAIAAALATERAKGEALRAAVLAVAEEIDTAADVQNVLGAGDGRIRQLIELADRLRAAVEPR